MSAPGRAHSYGCKSRRKLITANEAKRNGMRTTECGEEGGEAAARIVRSGRRTAGLLVWQATGSARQRATEQNMSTSLEVIQAEVMRLSPSDRSRLLERLIVSLDADAEVEAEWDAIADARENDVVSGAAAAIPLEQALARLEARFNA